MVCERSCIFRGLKNLEVGKLSLITQVGSMYLKGSDKKDTGARVRREVKVITQAEVGVMWP